MIGRAGPASVAGPNDLPDWERAASERRSTAAGYLLAGVLAGAVAAVSLTVVASDPRPFLVMAVATWTCLRCLANAVDLVCDVAWDWGESGGRPRQSKRADAWALALAAGAAEVVASLRQGPEPVVPWEGGIEIVEIVDPVEAA